MPTKSGSPGQLRPAPDMTTWDPGPRKRATEAFDRRDRLWTRYVEVTDLIATRNRNMTADEQRDLDRLESELDQAAADASAWLDHDGIDLSVRINQDKKAANPDAGKAPAAVYTSRSHNVDNFDIRGLFDEASKHGFAEATLSPEQTTRALATSTDTVSPASFIDQISIYLRQAAPVMDLADVRVTQDARGLIRPHLSADAAGGGTVTAEGAGITVADPTFGSTSVSPVKLASMTYLSTELARDSALDMAQIVGQSAGRQLGHAANAFLTTGTGSGEPEGYVTGATLSGTAEGTAATADVNVDGIGRFGPSDILGMLYSLDYGYRSQAVLTVSSASAKAIFGWRDAQGNGLVLPASAGATARAAGGAAIAGFVWGVPIVVNDDLADDGSAVTTALAIGDFSAFLVNALPLRVEISKDYRFANDQWAIRTILELDSGVVDAAAIKKWTTAAY